MAPSLTVGRSTDAAPAPDSGAAGGVSILYLPASSRDRSAVGDRLTRIGVPVTAAADVTEALHLLGSRRHTLCVVDLADDRTALGAIRLLRTRYTQQPVAAVLDPANPMAAAEALGAGGVDLIPWPFEEQDVQLLLTNACDRAGVERPAQAPTPDAQQLFAQSAAMRSVAELVRAAAEVRGGVLVSGEAGTGRELVARAIHRSAEGGDDRPLVAVDCAAAPQALEQRLFGLAGDRKQSDGKSMVDRVGRAGAIVQARGGTLLLVNLVDAPARVQARLARLLRDREAQLVEKRAILELDVRPIALVDPMIETAVTDGRVRRELYERLAQTVIDVPPLRRRREDIPALAAHFLRSLGDKQGLPPKTFSRSALTLLSALPWHGNARELQQLIATLVRCVRRQVIQLDDLLDQTSLDGLAARVDPGLTLREAKARFERDCISAMLLRHHGRVGEAAKALGIQRTNLYRKVRQLNVSRTLLSPKK